ncbi:hypothetical protein AZH53_01385 [Methanomicrobiaceae archaeon CYW5]|uniref:methanogenesis marker 17 protein n=1 Tax=Methanovulcanius yangii TaxID=1789227 RepID=UPI0029CA319A|nr:methanogenesis marker 17 protein [Methanovulcanius yangii]MBT8507082.1 hypothetical protein [Methanovulcanius yangii]
MDALEYFEVECAEEVGRQTYHEIADNILKDLDLSHSIGRLHIYIDPETPLFLAVGLIKQIPGRVRIGDFSSAIAKEDGIVLDIGEETYLSQMLTVLWDMFGRDQIDQPDRFTVFIRVPGLNPREIEKIEVMDPSAGLFRDIIYALQWIAPEGFKVRRESIGKGRFFYLASENTLDEDLVETLVAEKFRLMEEAE